MARAAQKDWAARPLAERIALVRAGIARLRALNDEIVPEIAWQMGRPIRYGGEIGGVEERAYHMADIAEAALAPMVIEDSDTARRMIRRQPLGVVLVIAPWNYPYLTAVNTIAPALIAGNAVVQTLAHQQLIAADPAARLLRGRELTTAILQAAGDGSALAEMFRWTNILGNPNLALFLAAMLALITLWTRRQYLVRPIPQLVESALMSGGVIILITAAGGAFGAMLRAAGLGDAIQGLAESQIAGQESTSLLTGLPLLLLAFVLASVLKFAQGSSTTAMIVTSGMIVAMIDPASLAFNAVYVALAIGAGLVFPRSVFTRLVGALALAFWFAIGLFASLTLQ